MKGLLFLCVANSARSQMAEGIACLLAPAGTRIWSAGARPTSVRPEAIAVLREMAIDISGQRAKAVADIPASDVDMVITLCAEQECPVFLGNATRLHWGLKDPAAVTGSEQERIAAFRLVRDELWQRIRALWGEALPLEKFFDGQGLVINGITHLSGREARAAVEHGALLVDLREDYETVIRRFDLPSVVFLPNSAFSYSYAQLPKTRPIVLADEVGLRSKEAVVFLQEHGFLGVASLNGGIVDWEKEGLPTVTDSAEIRNGACGCNLRSQRDR